MKTDLELKIAAIEMMREIDIINDNILKLKKEEVSLRTNVKNIKRQIESNNSYLIGKFAACTMYDNPTFQRLECRCSFVLCSDDFAPIPMFNRKGQNVEVDEFKWM